MPVSLVDYTALPHPLADQSNDSLSQAHHLLTGPTTLVISDDYDLRLLLIEGLHSLSYTAIGATHGPQALAILDQHPIHRVVLDYPLSTRTMTTTCTEIREHAYDTEIIVLAASSEQMTQRQTQVRGADWYIQKPFGLAELRSALQALHSRGHRVKLPVLGNSYVRLP